MIRINEIFDSWEGEGRDTGIPTTVVRLQGCDLNPHCSWCDTPTAWDLKGGIELPVDVVANRCHCDRVLITGGEPLLQKDGIVELVSKLKNKRIVVETSGLYDFSDLPNRVRIVADLKTPSSGVKMTYEYIRSLTGADDLVAVCMDAEDVSFAKKHFLLLRKEGCSACFFFSFNRVHVGLLRLLDEFEDNFYRIQIQLHKVLNFR